MRSFKALDKELQGKMAEAKIRAELGDDWLGKELLVSGKTLQNKRAAGTLHKLPYFKICRLAELAGYELKFVPK